jgi:DNA-binding MarR family transcriptional regulator
MTTRNGAGALRLWQALAAATAAVRNELDAGAPGCPVLGSDTVTVLLPLADAPDRQLRMNELAERAHLTPSGLTRRIDRLEAGGLVARAHCPGDRRGAYARLTDDGASELARALPYHGATLEAVVTHRLTGAAQTDLINLLERLAGTRNTQQETT